MTPVLVPEFIVGDIGSGDTQNYSAEQPEAIKPDWSVLYRCWIDLSGTCHVDDCWFDRLRIPRLTDAIFSFATQKLDYWTMTLYFEGTKEFDGLKDSILQHGQLDIYPIPVSTDENAKKNRIANLIPQIKEGRIKVRDGEEEWQRALEAQLNAFPKQVNGHDDFIDALSLVPLAIALKPPATRRYAPPDIRDYFKKRDDDDDGSNGGGFAF